MKIKKLFVMAHSEPRRSRSIFPKVLGIYQQRSVRNLRQNREHWTLFSCLPLSCYSLESLLPPSFPPFILFLIDDQPPALSSLSDYFIAMILYWIWLPRNSATFRNSVLTSQQIIDFISNDVRLRIQCAPAKSVRNFWSQQSILCLVNNGLITFYC